MEMRINCPGLSILHFLEGDGRIERDYHVYHRILNFS
jgi:hypothetical protein